MHQRNSIDSPHLYVLTNIWIIKFQLSLSFMNEWLRGGSLLLAFKSFESTYMCVTVACHITTATIGHFIGVLMRQFVPHRFSFAMFIPATFDLIGWRPNAKFEIGRKFPLCRAISAIEKKEQKTKILIAIY